MRWSGVIFFAFLLFHLADLTWGIQPVAPETWARGEVYANFVATFSRAPVTIFYVISMVCLGIHLYHGAWSMFQSVGLNHPSYNAAAEVLRSRARSAGDRGQRHHATRRPLRVRGVSR